MMEYDENLKRKHPYKFYYIGMDINGNFEEKFDVFKSNVISYIPRKNFQLSLDINKWSGIWVCFYFKNKEDSFLFKLNFADDEIFKRQRSPGISMWTIDE
jgi:hypothetical protein